MTHAHRPPAPPPPPPPTYGQARPHQASSATRRGSFPPLTDFLAVVAFLAILGLVVDLTAPGSRSTSATNSPTSPQSAPRQTTTQYRVVARWPVPPQNTIVPGARRMALAPTTDGGVAVLDGRRSVVFRFDASGVARVAATPPSGAVDLAIGDDGAVFLSTASRAPFETTGSLVTRLDGASAKWSAACGCDWSGGRLASGSGLLLVTQARAGRVAVLDAATGQPIRSLSGQNAGELWPADVAMDGGWVYTANMLDGQVETWSTRGQEAGVWQAGLLDGPLRLAVGTGASGERLVAVLTTDQVVEVHSAADGNLLERFKPQLPNGAAIEVADLAFGSGGRLYLADVSGQAIQVLEPRPAVLPTAGPTSARPTAVPTPSSRSCTVRGDKVVSPNRIVLGETARIALTFRAVCPPGTTTASADVVFVMDVSSSMSGEKMESAKAAAIYFTSQLDARGNRVGVVTFSSSASILVPLTHDLNGVVAAINSLGVSGGTDIPSGLRAADQHLRQSARIGAGPVVILLTDGQGGDEADARALAQAMRQRGVLLYTIGLGSDVNTPLLTDLAGDPTRYFFSPGAADLDRIFRTILRRVMGAQIGNIVLDDQMGDAIVAVGGSADPPAVAAPDRLRWGRAQLPQEGLRFSYFIKPSRTGLLPTNRSAVADYSDADGVRRQYVFPIPVIEVVAPTASPSPTASPTATPTATATPTVTLTPTATPTLVPLPVFLPILLKDPTCKPELRTVNVALVLDASSSMLEPAGGGASGGVGPGKPTKMDAARLAAKAFLDQLRLAYGDQAALVSFHHTATVHQGLTRDRSLLERAFDLITVDHSTRIDLGIDAGHRLLIADRARPKNRPVLILLTDGKSNPAPVSVAVDRAAETKRDGVTIFTIGLGSDLDLEALRQMATRTDYFYDAPDAGDLVGIYRRIADQLPCPVSLYWGRR